MSEAPKKGHAGNRIDAMLARQIEFAQAAAPVRVRGRLSRATGLVMEATGLRLPVGAVCTVGEPVDPARPDGARHDLEAEVVGFGDGRLFLMPTGDFAGVCPGAPVQPVEPVVRRPTLSDPSHPRRRSADRSRYLPMGNGLLGRVVDAHGVPLDHRGPLAHVRPDPIAARALNAMDRDPIRVPLDTGVRAINAMFSVGRGQRLGLFAGAGVGKSVLLGMMSRFTSADVTVVGLIGERGREVKEFIEDILGAAGLERAVVVAAPSDAPPLVRMQGANYATAIAEDFRRQGRHVLLLMDSLTRYAMAAREVSLAIGEPPATKGYPPSVFARLPMLIERAGNGPRGQGSITAFYTVLVDGDDPGDPVADSARAILDGHIVLDRSLAESGHYPAIDIEQSISRVMTNVAGERHLALARRFRSLWSRYEATRDLIAVGAYVGGADPETDLAISVNAQFRRFLQQGVTERSTFDDSLARLEQLVGPLVDAGG
jgi:flagellum-specific ATP synthase